MEPDDGHDDEAPAYRQPPSPDDRLWRHPSEVAAPRTTPEAARTRSVWLIGALSAVVGGVLVTGVAAATGVFADHPSRRSGAATTAGDTMAQTVLAAALRARASTVTIEARSDHPILPFRLLADRNRAASYLVMLGLAGSIFAVSFFLTQLLQTVFGYSPLRTGALFLPFSLGIVGTSEAVAKLIGRVRPRVFATAGPLNGPWGVVKAPASSTVNWSCRYWTL